MNPLYLILTAVIFFSSSAHGSRFFGSRPASLVEGGTVVTFAFTRPIACTGTENNAVFYSALKAALDERKSVEPAVASTGSVTSGFLDEDPRYKLFDLINCPNADQRFSELTEPQIVDLKESLSPAAREELQLVLNRVHYGILQVDIDHSVEKCFNRMKTVTLTANMCADLKCKGPQIDALLETIIKGNECRYYFIKPQIKAMLEEIKKLYNLADAVSDNDKALSPAELERLVRDFANKAPTGYSRLVRDINNYTDSVKYSARSNLNKLLN